MPSKIFWSDKSIPSCRMTLRLAPQMSVVPGIPRYAHDLLNTSVNLNLKLENCLSPLHDCGKRFGVEAGAAHQASVNFFLRHQRLGIFRLDASAVQDAQLLGCLVSEGEGGLFADHAVRIDSDLGDRSFAGADGPHGFVSYGEFGDLLAGNSPQSILALAAQYIIGNAGLALFEHLAAADNGGQSSGEGRL